VLATEERKKMEQEARLKLFRIGVSKRRMDDDGGIFGFGLVSFF
jgi:hypothetical protein